LLEDRFDSIYRRNLIEPDAPTQNEKKRQKKLKYKMVNPLGAGALELQAKNAAAKARNDEKEKGLKALLNSDVIQI